MAGCRLQPPAYIAPAQPTQPTTRPIRPKALEKTLAILKPDCVRKRLVGAVAARIEEAGFAICGMRMLLLSQRDAEAFYQVHQSRPFFAELVRFMTSGPVVVMALERENAVAGFRALIGATDPAEAAEGTVRRDFADSKGENIVHGSDSVANGQREISFFFATRDLNERILLPQP